jgi:hypothetical protein
MYYPPFPARSEARSALPAAPVLEETPSHRRLQLPRHRPLAWRRVVDALAPRRLVGARF